MGMTSLHRRHAVPFAARAAVTAAALTLLTGLLAGCSKSAEPATGGTGPQVASLQTAAPQTTVAQNVDDQRPLVRLDASEAEVEALWKVWGDCILEAGGPGYEDPRAIYWKKSAKNRQI